MSAIWRATSSVEIYQRQSCRQDLPCMYFWLGFSDSNNYLRNIYVQFFTCRDLWEDSFIFFLHSGIFPTIISHGKALSSLLVHGKCWFFFFFLELNRIIFFLYAFLGCSVLTSIDFCFSNRDNINLFRSSSTEYL